MDPYKNNSIKYFILQNINWEGTKGFGFIKYILKIYQKDCHQKRDDKRTFNTFYLICPTFQSFNFI